MGFRIRKSIKIAPGIKYNLNKSGGSLSLGGRGKSLNISAKGIKGTVGIPGTGISYSTSLNSSQRSVSNRDAYNALLKQQKEEEKKNKLETAKQEVDEYNVEIYALSKILKERDQTVFDWEKLTITLGEYKQQEYIPPEFVEPNPEYSEDYIKRKLENESGKYYLTLFFLGVFIVFLFLNLWISIFALCAMVIVLRVETKQHKREIKKKIKLKINQEKAFFHKNRRLQYQEYLKNIEISRTKYIELEPSRRDSWEKEETFRARLRQAVENEDIEVLTELLEKELLNEDLPVPLVFDIEFEQLDTAKIFMELPDIEVVPTEEKILTKTGKLSLKKMTQTKRFKIFFDVCTGLSLRLIYETFRVLPMVDCVEIHGMTDAINLASGNPQRMTSLYSKIVRSDFEKLNLNEIDPSIAFNSLNGKFSCNKRGEFSSIIL
jgi:hypothetical protein